MKLFGGSRTQTEPVELSKNDLAKQLVELTDQLSDKSEKLRRLVNEIIEDEKANDAH